jgi:hypothetical protein
LKTFAVHLLIEDKHPEQSRTVFFLAAANQRKSGRDCITGWAAGEGALSSVGKKRQSGRWPTPETGRQPAQPRKL